MKNRYGSSTLENGKIRRVILNSWCHQCKVKQSKIVVCDHFWNQDVGKCNGRYCTNCCRRHYNEMITDIELKDNWICFKCSDKCVCAACRRERNPSEPENKRKICNKTEKRGRPKKIKTETVEIKDNKAVPKKELNKIIVKKEVKSTKLVQFKKENGNSQMPSMRDPNIIEDKIPIKNIRNTLGSNTNNFNNITSNITSSISSTMSTVGSINGTTFLDISISKNRIMTKKVFGGTTQHNDLSIFTTTSSSSSMNVFNPDIFFNDYKQDQVLDHFNTELEPIDQVLDY
eukprot:TRINITY_DN10905_c0_g1_i1.p1 TRINITY_DN10905_c0_g1~~TRINITY_DN10905_c0_g1_i1.p1  ORF type:complete len:301 (+),score=57.14 TRINITY_DN10905_c0_g1_i1:44-904(+)